MSRYPDRSEDRRSSASRITYHASPKFIVPRHSGETRTPAVVESTRWKSSKLRGGAGSPNMLLIVAGVLIFLLLFYFGELSAQKQDQKIMINSSQYDLRDEEKKARQTMMQLGMKPPTIGATTRFL
jgi:hypothetical protein